MVYQTETNMNIYRIHPGNDAFEIRNKGYLQQSIYLPYLDIIADDETAAIRGAEIIMPGFNTEHCVNTLNYVELISKH